MRKLFKFEVAIVSGELAHKHIVVAIAESEAGAKEYVKFKYDNISEIELVDSGMAIML